MLRRLPGPGSDNRWLVFGPRDPSRLRPVSRFRRLVAPNRRRTGRGVMAEPRPTPAVPSPPGNAVMGADPCPRSATRHRVSRFPRVELRTCAFLPRRRYPGALRLSGGERLPPPTRPTGRRPSGPSPKMIAFRGWSPVERTRVVVPVGPPLARPWLGRMVRPRRSPSTSRPALSARGTSTALDGVVTGCRELRGSPETGHDPSSDGPEP